MLVSSEINVMVGLVGNPMGGISQEPVTKANM